MACVVLVDSETGLYNSRSFGVGALKVSQYYDPSLSLWLGVDPLADDPDQVSFTPYHYTYNNPIKFTDPIGMKADTSIITTQDGSTELFRWDDGSTENTIYSTLDQVNISDSKVEKGNEQTVSNFILAGDVMLGSALYSVSSSIDKSAPMLNRWQVPTKGDIRRLRFNLFGNVTFKGQQVLNLRNFSKFGGPALGFAGVAYNSQHQSKLSTGFDAAAYGASFVKGGFGITLYYSAWKMAITNYWNMTPEEQKFVANPYTYSLYK